MKSIYLTKTDFDKCKTIESFPNPNIKIGIYNNETAYLCVGDKIKFTIETDPIWFDLPNNFIISMKAQSGHFPTNLFFEVKDRRYQNSEYFKSREGNSGTASSFCNLQGLLKAIDIFTKNNFIIDLNEIKSILLDYAKLKSEIKESKFWNIDISEAMSEEEKRLTKEISYIYSVINQIIKYKKHEKH